jgi:hypothetical protein
MYKDNIYTRASWTYYIATGTFVANHGSDFSAATETHAAVFKNIFAVIIGQLNPNQKVHLK